MYFVGNIKNYSKISHWKTLISAINSIYQAAVRYMMLPAATLMLPAATCLRKTRS
jgi:hypothetical protein